MNARQAKTLKMTAALVVLMAVGAGLAWLLDSRENAPKPAPAPFAAPSAPARTAAPKEPPREAARPGSPFVSRPPKKNLIQKTPAPQNSVPADATPPPAPPAPPPEAVPPPVVAKKPVQDPIARAALSLVGKDEEAEAIWIAAINNPELSASERKDLIEDLNEDGFADPRRPTADDVPLIQSRLLLIERLLPEALDETNAAAFAEAYKDLLQMLARAAQ